MRPRLGVAAVSALVAVIAGAIVATAVRSEAQDRRAAPSAGSGPVVLARVDDGGPTVTVPAWTASGPGAPDSPSPAAAPASGLVVAPGAALSSAASIASARSQSAASDAARAADASLSSRAAADRAAVRSAAAAAASASSSRAAASSASASSAARASAKSAASASASSVASASSASSLASVASASSVAASSQAAASRAAADAYAAAHPAPDTSEAVEQAVDRAADDGISQSVVVMNKQTGEVTTAVDADRQLPSMSLVKLFLAADVIHQAGGVDDVDADTLTELRQMIVNSDDSIAQDFYDDDGKSAIITRVADEYGLTGTTPSPEVRYWGDVRITAGDMASFLYQLLSDDETRDWFSDAMTASADTGADGFDQNFGVNSVAGAGSKQGWGCCLGGVLSMHSVGFTAGQIIVVLSSAPNDVAYTKLDTAAELTADPGAQRSVAAVTRTVDAALPPP